MKTLEEFQKQLDEIQYQIDKLKKVGNANFYVIDNYHIEEWTSPVVNDDMGKELFIDCKNFNGFNTQEDAERMQKNINARAAMFHIAKHMNDGWEPDWREAGINKYNILYNTSKNKCDVIIASQFNYGEYCFKTREAAEKAIKLMESKNLLKDYFMIWED